jgi:hypothetical protein
MNQILVLLTAWTIATAPTGHHYAFPSTVEWNGQQYTMFRDGSGHNSVDSEVVICDEAGSVVYRFTRKMFSTNPTAALYPGTLSVVDGVIYAPLSVLNWDTMTARTYLMVSTNMHTWARLTPPHQGTRQQPHGKVFRVGAELFMPAYTISPGVSGWQSVLWAYNLTTKTWAVRGKIVPPPGYRCSEMSIVILPTGWLAAVRSQRDTKEYTPEWFDFYRSANQGKSWTKISSLAPNYNAGRLAYVNGRLLLAYRGDGGASVRESIDGGLTWGAPLRMEGSPVGDCAMPDIAPVRGEIRAVWYSANGAAIRGGTVK